MNVTISALQIGSYACTHTLWQRRRYRWSEREPEWEGDHPRLLTHCGGTSSSIQHLMRTDWLFLLLLPAPAAPLPRRFSTSSLLCPFPSVWRQRATSQLKPRDPAGEVGRDNAAHPGGCISTHGPGFVLLQHEHPSNCRNTCTHKHPGERSAGGGKRSCDVDRGVLAEHFHNTQRRGE